MGWQSAGGHTGPVSAQAAAKAADWCEYLDSHAKRVYAACMLSDIHNAHRLAQKIKTGKIIHGMTVRDIYRKQWAGINKTATTEALDLLEEYHWLSVEEIQPDSGRPSQVIRLHPDLRGKSDG